MYSFVPFVLFFIINVLLIRVFLEHTRSPPNAETSYVGAKKSPLPICASVMAMTLFFVVFTSPSAVCSQFYNTLITTYSGNVILTVSQRIGFSYHALNIVILCVFNNKFANILWKRSIVIDDLEINE